MSAWSFQPRFRFALLNGLAEIAGAPLPFPGHQVKRQTVRALRADGRDPLPGDPMRIWIAQRTPERELLGATPGVQRYRVEIPHAGSVVLELRWLTDAGLTRLAHLDGFDSAQDFFAFFGEQHRFPFAGYCYRW